MSKTSSREQRKKDWEELRKNPVNQFTCCDKTMGFKEFKEHLTNDHKLNADQLKGKKQTTHHIDGDYWFSWNYHWELESGLKFTQYTMQARAKETFF